MLKVVFDSSFLIAVLERPTTWYEDAVEKVGKFEPVILDCVKEELAKLSESGTKRARYARLAADLTKEFKLERCEGGLPVDDEITSYSKGASALVATVDGTLLSSLKKMHVGAITLKSGRVALA